MPAFVSDGLGSLADAVQLQLGDDVVRIAESWDVQEGIMAQPAVWSIRLGWGSTAAELLNRYPPRTPFRLYVAGHLQATGRIDGRFAAQPKGSGCQITIRGRDSLAPLHDAMVRASISFSKVTTYRELVEKALEQVGIDKSSLIVGNDGNRKLKAGIIIPEISYRTVDEIIARKQLGFTIGAVADRTVEAKVNETWHHFVRRHLDRAGLFLWAGAEGGFVLAQPNGGQPPSYRLVRKRGLPALGTNVVSMTFEDDATHRHSECVIYGRSGGKKYGRAKSKGHFEDAEMLAYGYDQAVVFRDVQVQTQQEAEYFARRKLAEERRDGWRLEYTIAGHTLPSAGNPKARAVLTPDTVVEVDDEEIGLSGNFYIESVRRQRAPETTTTVRLMRLQDLIFGGADG